MRGSYPSRAGSTRLMAGKPLWRATFDSGRPAHRGARRGRCAQRRVRRRADARAAAARGARSARSRSARAARCTWSTCRPRPTCGGSAGAGRGAAARAARARGRGRRVSPRCSGASSATSSAPPCAAATACATRPGPSRPKVGRTPKDVVWRRHKAELWRYRNDDVRYRPPVVIVHSLVSRSYVLDLYPGNSAIAFLLGARASTSILARLGRRRRGRGRNTLETYSEGLHARGDRAPARRPADDVTLLGYCFGGVLSLLAAARRPELPIRNLVLMATPVDFTGMQAITGARARGPAGPRGR